MPYRLLTLLLLLPGVIAPAQAGIFGRKKDKIDPKSRVPELIITLKSDGDADKRARAAEELRNFDASAHPEIIPALIDALLNDKKPTVRAEAAQSLGKIRPVSQTAGDALEQAHANDSSMRVRLQARSSLLSYHWAGYRTTKKGDTPPLNANAKEPPVVNTTNPPPASANNSNNKSSQPTVLPTLRPTPTSNSSRTNRVPQALTPATPSTKEPPLAPPTSTPPVAEPVLTPVPVAPPVIAPPVTAPPVVTTPSATPAPLPAGPAVPSSPKSGTEGPDLP
ncbi:MAG: HEAT repeat domain-containing protein [Gemmataceae bacterium]